MKSSSSSPAVRASATALTALIMAQGATTTAQAKLAPEDAAKASAQEATKLSTVTVEDTRASNTIASPKYTQPVVDVPQTVISIPKEVFVQQGAVTLSDALRNTPGITMAAGEGGSAASTAGDSFYMRGFDTTNSIFVDGVRNVGAYSRDVYNTEQVDVVKGPAGADVGRGAATGYVNLVTKTPHLENFVTGALTYGFDEQTSGARRRATIDLNQVVPGETVKGAAVRLNAMWQDSNGVGRDFAENKDWAIAPSLALGLGTPTRVTVEYEHLKQNNLPDYGLPVPAFPGYVSTPPSPHIDDTTFYGFTRDFDRVTADSVQAKIEHDFSPDLRLSNQTRYSTVAREAVVTGPGSSATSYVPATQLLTRTRQGNKRDTSVISNQTNLVDHFSTGSIRHDVTAGLELSRERAYSPAFTSASLTPILVAQPDPNALPSGSPVRSGVYSNVLIDTGAVYAFDTLKFDEHWQFDGGIRVDHYLLDFSTVTAGVPAPAEGNNNIVSWKTGLVYKPVPAGSLYVAYGVSAIPPASDFTISTAAGNQNNPLTTPQRTSSVEAGVKWEFFRHRLQTGVAGFQTENDNTVFTDPVLGPIPAGKQTVKGLEVNATGKISDTWLLFAGFSYLDSVINTGSIAGGAAANAPLPLIPKWSGNLWTTYRLARHLTLGGGTQYMGEVFRRDSSTTVSRTMPSYWLFNGLVAWEVNSRLSLRLNVNNLFDRDFVQSYNNNGARFNPGAPRSYLITATFKF